jgi:hypothetical protein
MNRHFKLQIKTLENAPRRMRISCKNLKSKRKGKAAGNNTHRRHTERLLIEIEMLKVVLHLVSRSHG